MFAFTIYFVNLKRIFDYPKGLISHEIDITVFFNMNKNNL